MVLSPVVRGTNQMLETQVFDMEKYREQKEQLEYEAMVRNPETAFLVSNEEFDKQLEELGEDQEDYDGLYGYSLGQTEHLIPVYEYPPYEFKQSEAVSNLEV